MAIPTLRSVLDRGGSLVLMSHLGRPSGTGYQPEFSLEPVATRLAELLEGVPVGFPGKDCTDGVTATAVESMQAGDVIVLENLRFHEGEKAGDPDFASRLAAYGDIYVNDAFGTAHRDHASMVAVPEAMSGRPRVAGLLLLKELHFLSDAIEHARSPFIAVLGGAKVSDKLGAIRNLLPRVDAVIIGGGMAYTFLHAQGHQVGKSLLEEEMIPEALAVLGEARDSDTLILLPVDHACAKGLDDVEGMSIEAGDIPQDLMGLDLGPVSIAAAVELLLGGGTIVWNGPVGVFERSPFDEGTRAVGTAVAEATDGGATSVIGGGETAAAVDHFGLASRVSHVSTGGGASLRMLEGRSFHSVDLLDQD